MSNRVIASGRHCTATAARVLLLLSVALSTALGDSFTFQTLDFPGSSFTQAFGINSSGEIVGALSSGGFVYNAGNFSNFDVPGSTHTGAKGINELGQIVGEYDTSSAGPIAFLYSGGSFTSISPPGASSATANGINSTGLIVGQYTDSTHSGNEQGFLYDGKAFTTIDFPGTGSGTGVEGINSAGDVVGFYYLNNDNTTIYSFLYSNGVFTTISMPGCSSSAAFGISDDGTIVGTCFQGQAIGGFVYRGGNFSSLNFPGSSSTLAYGINNEGQVVGQYSDATGGQNVNSFIANPVNPEAPNFAITANPSSEIAYRGVLAAFILKLQSVHGFNGNVKLSCSGGPAGSKCADLPQTVHVNGTAYAVSGMTFPKSTTPGTYTITFTGVSGSLSNTATAKFTVK
jgi:probable HAF family extracellular repeat protein